MCLKNIEAMVYIFMSNVDFLVYFTMLRCVYENAGLISIVYPIGVFGYALIEETRPRKWFWTLTRQYTQVVLVVKFIFSVRFINDYMYESESIEYFLELTKIGIQAHDSIGEHMLYIAPEIMLISALMINEIVLKLQGIYDKIE